MSINPETKPFFEEMNARAWFSCLRGQTRKFEETDFILIGIGSIVSHRFKDVRCPLESAPNPELIFGDERVLHANHVEMIDGSRYILTQAPQIHTRELFWKTCMSGGSRLIVDLTNENDRTKDRTVISYYPEDKGSTDEAGSIKISCIEQEEEEEVITSTYTVEDSQKGLSEKITRIHYLGWEDYGATASKKLLNLINHIDSVASGMIGPITVHCKAGVGRTGSFVTSRTLKKLADAKRLSKDNFEKVATQIILSGREQRGPYFVQTHNQLEGIIEFAELILSQSKHLNTD